MERAESHSARGVRKPRGKARVLICVNSLGQVLSSGWNEKFVLTLHQNWSDLEVKGDPSLPSVFKITSEPMRYPKPPVSGQKVKLAYVPRGGFIPKEKGFYVLVHSCSVLLCSFTSFLLSFCPSPLLTWPFSFTFSHRLITSFIRLQSPGHVTAACSVQTFTFLQSLLHSSKLDHHTRVVESLLDLEQPEKLSLPVFDQMHL